jgi:hypothetical protein
VALVPRRGSLVVVYSGFIERLNRLKDAYVEYYSDAFGGSMCTSGCAWTCLVSSSFHQLLPEACARFIRVYNSSHWWLPPAVSVAKDPDIIFEESIDYRAEDDQMFDLAMKVRTCWNHPCI